MKRGMSNSAGDLLDSRRDGHLLQLWINFRSEIKTNETIANERFDVGVS